MSAAAAGSALERIEQAHGAARGRLHGGSAWDRRRSEALARLVAQGLPDRRDENWKYLDWAEIERRNFSLSAPGAVEAGLPAGTLADLAQGNIVVLVDGHYVEGLSTVIAGTGISVEGLSSALERDPEALARVLRVPGDGADDRFALLAEAFVEDGAVARLREPP